MKKTISLLILALLILVPVFASSTFFSVGVSGTFYVEDHKVKEKGKGIYASITSNQSFLSNNQERLQFKIGYEFSPTSDPASEGIYVDLILARALLENTPYFVAGGIEADFHIIDEKLKVNAGLMGGFHAISLRAFDIGVYAQYRVINPTGFKPFTVKLFYDCNVPYLLTIH